MYEGLKNLDVPGPGKRPRARRWVKLALAGLLVFAVGMAGTYSYVLKKVNDNLNKGKNKQISELQKALPNGPLNILVLGSDRRDVIEGEQRNLRQFRRGGGQRADTIIFVHLAAKADKAVLVSIPRDLRVWIPGRGYNKINSAYTFGGPNLMLKTVAKLTGVELNHYVEVNFSSFQSIVNAVGGVSVYVNRPLIDGKAGLNLPKAGCYELDGLSALSFVRARNIDPTADLGRIQRQQLFIRSLLARVKSLGFLLQPQKIIDLSDAVGKGLQYDAGVNLGLARAIASKLAGYNQKKLDFRIVPGYGDYIRGVSYVIPKKQQLTDLFTAIAADQVLPPYGKTKASVPEPADVLVKVLNGSGTTGIAKTEAARLKKLGFKIQTYSTGPSNSRTVITYNPDAALKVRLVARQYPGAVIKPATKQQLADVVVLIGKKFAQQQAAASASPSARPSATKAPVDDDGDDDKLLAPKCG